MVIVFFFVLDRANLAVFVLMLDSHLGYEVNFLNICNDGDNNDVFKIITISTVSLKNLSDL